MQDNSLLVESFDLEPEKKKHAEEKFGEEVHSFEEEDYNSASSEEEDYNSAVEYNSETEEYNSEAEDN